MKKERGLTLDERKNLYWNYLVLRGFWEAEYGKKKTKEDLYDKLGLPKGLGEKYSTCEGGAYHITEIKLRIVDPKFVKCLVGETKLDGDEIEKILGATKKKFCQKVVDDGITYSDNRETVKERRKEFESAMKDVYTKLQKRVREDMPFDEEKTKVIDRVIFWIKFGYEISSEGDKKLSNLWKAIQDLNADDYLQCKNVYLMQKLLKVSAQNYHRLKTAYNFRLLTEQASSNRKK